MRDWFKRNERKLSALAFLLGFTIDNFTLTRIDLLFDNLILGSYLFIAGVSIFLYQVFDRKEIKGWFSQNAVLFLPLFMQFAFGGLFSGYFVFYSRSASFSTTLIFVGIIIAILIANEFFKKRYSQITFQVSIFFVAIFSFLIFYIPILIKSIGVFAFILSGVLSLLVIRAFVFILRSVVLEKILKSRKAIMVSVLSIYIAFNALYFTNIIPPIPLSLKEGGAYYQVVKSGNTYIATTENMKWYEVFKKTTLYRSPGEPVYYFSSVFAPTDLDTEVFHSWQYFDISKDTWIEVDKLSYPIVGGRDGGYRGYSIKSSIFEGDWRVDVVTPRGQIIGRTTFSIIENGSLPETETISF